MSEPEIALSDETVQYMHQSPVFNMAKQRQFEYLRHVASEITTIANHFTQYADIGQKLCTEFANLRKSFDNMELICTDASVKPLCEIFEAVDTAFTHHFHVVNEKIVKPLNDFVTTHIESLPELEKRNQKEFTLWSTEEEKYVAMKTQVKEEKKKEKEQDIEKQHRVATLAFFDFATKMEMIDLKMKSLLPQMFISYLTSVSIPFVDCIARMTDKEEELNTTQNTINEVNQQIQEFARRSAEGKMRLSSQVSMFWKRANQPFNGTTSTSIQGYLWKKRAGALSKGWHKRFVTVGNGVLSWARTVDGALRSQKNVDLLLCSVKPEPSMPRNNCFSLTTNRKSMILQALTHWDMENWLAVIQNAIALALNAGAKADPDAPLQQTTVSTVCADCGAPNAAWASINWGVTLCEACCGEHRGIGVTYSKVRSLQLDTIDPMQRALVEAVGSERANQVLEAKIGDNKIDQQATTAARRKFIEMKYQERLFVDTSVEVDVFKAIKNQDLMGVFRYVASGKLNNLPQGFTPLHAAASCGNPLILHLLCLNVVTVDVPDEKGWTPLCYAAYYEQPQMLDLLTSYGATLRLEKVNPYDIAKSKGNEHMMTKLAAVMDTSTYSPDTDYQPLHDDLTPQQFNLGDFVADPRAYRKFFSELYLTRSKKKKIDSAVSTLRHRLSMGQHNTRPISESEESTEPGHTDAK